MAAKFFYRILCGFFLGLSIFAPGFSGSIVAIIMGVYRDLLRIMSNPFKRLKENIVFCLPLGIGALISAVLFVIAFKLLFEAHEKALYFLFAGLIAGNLPVIWAEVKKHEFKKRYLLAGALAAAFALAILALGPGQAAGGGIVTAGLPFLALGGFVTGILAFVPGMSVSTVLIVMGIYAQLLFAAEALLRLDFTYLVPLGLFGACVVAGLVLASRGIRALFEKLPGYANTAVLGFMSGSFAGILIQGLRIDDADFRLPAGGLMLAAGLAVSVLFIRLGKAMDKR